MHNKPRHVISVCAIMILIGTGFIISNFNENSVYHGNGITYIVEDDRECRLAVINSKGLYEERAGTTSEIFWMASSVYEHETVSVDNNNRIYRFTEREIETFDNVEKGIMAVLKVEEGYVLIREKQNAVFIDAYSQDFTEKLDEHEVPGTFQHCFVGEDKVYYSVSGDEEQFTGVYCYSPEDSGNIQLYYTDEVSEEIYPFTHNEKIYMVKNKLIKEAGNEDILEIYEMQGGGGLEIILDIEEPIKKVLVIGDEVYGLAGVNSMLLLKLNLSDGTAEQLFSMDNEEALGLYEYEGNVQILTDKGVYMLENNKMLRRYEIKAFNLMNKFY